MQIRKLTVLLLALVLAMGLSMPAFAAGYGPGTVGNEDPFVPSGEDPGEGGNNRDTTPARTTATTTPSRSSAAVGGSYASPSSVSSADVMSAASAAIDSANGSNVTVTLENVTTVSASALQDVFAEASAAGLAAVVNVDAVDGNTVIARVYITEAIAGALPANVDLSVSVDSEETDAVAAFFDAYFQNSVAVVSMGQSGAFGANVPVAVKVDLTGMDVNDLVLYSYDAATNTYNQLEADYSVDANGYLHFSTPVGGAIVISGGALVGK